MRILHTADWHVGRTIRGRDRADEHRAVLEEITSIAEQREVDLVIVAGDLFDLAAPTAASERIVYEALLGLARTGAEVVLISGNHDSPQRLRAVKPLLESGCGVHVGATLSRPDAGGVRNLTLRTKEIVSLAFLPFLSQRGIVKAADLMERDAFEHAQSYTERLQTIVSLLADALEEDAVRILIGHLSVVGAAIGGGERSVHSGLDYMVPSTIFPSTLHYAALGHFHRTQSIPAGCPVWYSGSPLSLDFGEGEQEKGVLVVEATATTPAKVESVPLQSGRKLRTLRGTLAALEAMVDDVGDDYLRVEVDEPYRPGLADEVRELLPHAVDVRIKSSSTEPRPVTDLNLTQQSPEKLFAEFLAERKKSNDDLGRVFHELLEMELESQRLESEQETGLEAGREAAREAGREAGLEAGREAGREAGLETVREAKRRPSSKNEADS
ncbi:MAG: exonuclease SbcCD subunit D C-terminal domain-containing protein [Candidatus Eisenbacteria bacterium]|nr:exonuclease SbcCD subunit D C-terminal domain-containing protein [Candidatus Eisenbacteria bacterium]